MRKGWGKIAGAAGGFLLWGGWGLAAGLLLGHVLDRLRSGAGQQGVQEAFFAATFCIMGYVAKADGRVSEAEIAMARSVMDRMALDETSRRRAIELFTQCKRQDLPLDEVLRRFRRTCGRRRNLLRLFVEIQFEAALADGELNPAETRVLRRICQALGFAPPDFERLAAMGRAERRSGRGQVPSLADAYALLNVEPSASDAEVKKAYRRLMAQHHPDKLVARGLPEEMMRLAEEKTREIRAAYDRVRRARGI